MLVYKNIQSLHHRVIQLASEYVSELLNYLRSKFSERRISVTANQINYLRYLEDKRSHQATEQLTDVRDRRSHYVAILGANETMRHNLASERAATASLGETQRHNVAQERVQALGLEETKRANLAKEAANLQSISVSLRDVQAKEAANRETARSNLARETETRRSNLAREAETARSNVRQEQLSADRNRIQELGVHLSRLSEQERIALGYAQDLTNQERNSIYSQLGILNAREQTRSNTAREKETHRSNVEQELERYRSNTVSEFQEGNRQQEQKRHNMALERAAAVQAGARAVDSVFGAFRTGISLSNAMPTVSTPAVPSTGGLTQWELDNPVIEYVPGQTEAVYVNMMQEVQNHG